jgi:hypothetical protein
LWEVPQIATTATTLSSANFGYPFGFVFYKQNQLFGCVKNVHISLGFSLHFWKFELECQFCVVRYYAFDGSIVPLTYNNCSSNLFLWVIDKEAATSLATSIEFVKTLIA